MDEKGKKDESPTVSLCLDKPVHLTTRKLMLDFKTK
jgi:hypothetical protein